MNKFKYRKKCPSWLRNIYYYDWERFIIMNKFHTNQVFFNKYLNLNL